MKTLTQALEEYLLYLKKEGSSATHIRTVHSRLRQFIEPNDEFPTDNRMRSVDSVTALDLHQHLFELQGGGRSDGTMAGYVGSMRAFWAWLVRDKEVKESPAENLRRYSYLPKKRRAAPSKSVDKLYAALRPFVAHRNYNPRDVRDALVVSLSLDSGSRIGEVHSLRSRDMEEALARGEIAENSRTCYTVIGRGKTGSKAVTFFNESAELYALWQRVNPFPNAEFVFTSVHTGRLLRPESMTRCFEGICEFAGIPVVRSHAIRKRNASDLQRAFGDPELTRLYLGHSSITVTMNHYNDVDQERVMEAAAELASSRRGDPLDLLFRPKSE